MAVSFTPPALVAFEIHEQCFRVARNNGRIEHNRFLEVGTFHGTHPASKAGSTMTPGGANLIRVRSEHLVYVVTNECGLVLYEEAHGPGHQEERGQPEGHRGDVPRMAVTVGNDHVISVAGVCQIDTFSEFHVIVQLFVIVEETGSLSDELSLRLDRVERETLRDVDLRCWILFKVDQLLRDIRDSDNRVIESGSCRPRVDALVIRMRSRVCFPVTISSHVTSSSDVMIADNFPPYNRKCLSHRRNCSIHRLNVYPPSEIQSRVAVPALDQIDQVQHYDEGDRDADVHVITRPASDRTGSGCRMRC